MPAPKYNEKAHTIIVTALRNRASLTSAAGQAGITYRALRSWLDSEDEQYEQLQSDVAEAEAEHEEYLRRLAESAATEGDGATIRFLLERRFPKTYGAKQALEHTGKDGGPIQTSNVSLDDLDALRAAAEQNEDD